MVLSLAVLLTTLSVAWADCLSRAELDAQAAELGRAFDAAVQQALAARGLTLARPTLHVQRNPGGLVVPIGPTGVRDLGEIIGSGEGAGRVVGQRQTMVAAGFPSSGPTSVVLSGQPWQDVAILATDADGTYHLLKVERPTHKAHSCGCHGMGVSTQRSQTLYLLPSELPWGGVVELALDTPLLEPVEPATCGGVP